MVRSDTYSVTYSSDDIPASAFSRAMEILHNPSITHTNSICPAREEDLPSAFKESIKKMVSHHLKTKQLVK